MKSSNVFVILSHPFTADNIGASARAMKNMGFSNLRLVAPRRNWKKRAYVLARSADEIIRTAKIYSSLSEAVADLHWTYGTTRRTREKSAKFTAFDTFLGSVIKKSLRSKVGIVFGRESKGLSAEELDHCDELVSLPADAAYPSLNLAQAVMVALFSLAQKKLLYGMGNAVGQSRTCLPAGKAQSKPAFLDKAGVQSAMQSFAEALECIGFYGGKDGRLDKIIKITDAVFKRAGMFDYEAQMLKGVSARIIQRASQNK